MFYKRSFAFITIMTLIYSLFTITGPTPTYALSCAEEETADVAFERSEAVFSGYVSKSKSFSYTFKVEDVYKGSLQKTVKVRGSEWDGDFYDTDEKLLIYSKGKKSSGYYMDACGRSGYFSILQDDVQGITPTKPEPDPLLRAPMWTGIFIAGAGLSVFLFKRFRKNG